MPTTALKRARSATSCTAARSARYPMKRKKTNRVRVSLASHVHQVPHIGLAQMGPVVSMTALNATPTSADAAAKRSSRESLSHRYSALAMPTSENASSADHAAGTCR
jgi:hypothetical protein